MMAGTARELAAAPAPADESGASPALRGMILCDPAADDRRPFGAVLLDVVDGRPWVDAVLALLIRAGAAHTLIVAAPPVAARLQRLLGDGSQWGVRVSLALLDETATPQAACAAVLRAAAEFPGRATTVLHNARCLLHGPALQVALQACVARARGATLLAMPAAPGDDTEPSCQVDDAQRVVALAAPVPVPRPPSVSSGAPSAHGAARRRLAGFCVYDARLPRALLAADDNDDRAAPQGLSTAHSPAHALNTWYLRRRALYAVTAGAGVACECMRDLREAAVPVAVRETPGFVSTRAIAACPVAAAFARRLINESQVRTLAQDEPPGAWREHLQTLAAGSGSTTPAPEAGTSVDA